MPEDVQMRGRVVSVNVAIARAVPWKGATVVTGIYKTPVPGRVHVRALGLEGDEQADRRVHGGPLKAVYLYPSEHYAAWMRELGGVELPFGTFGENLTTGGLLERETRIGDVIRAGSAVLRVTKPRFPCFKLGVKFGREDILDLFLLSRRSGFYAEVLQEGDVAAGDSLETIGGDDGRPSVSDIVDARIRAQEEEE